MPQYSMNYDTDGAVQNNAPREPHNDNQRDDMRRPPGREIRFRIPNILKTALIFIAGAIALISWEMAAPEGYRPSTFVGVYDARITAAVKASELQQQTAFDAWAAQVKLAADQQSEHYKATTQGVLANYAASYDQVKISTQAAYQFQAQYASTIMQQKVAQQGSDIGIINFMRGFGRIMNGLEPGAGDASLGYADELGGVLQQEVTDAAKQGTGTFVVDWAHGLPTPEQVAATLDNIKPLRLPPPPVIGEKRTTIGGLSPEGE
jgi:hypothetical protein